MEEVIKQAPANIDDVTIEAIFKKHNGDVILTLAELWDIETIPNKEKTKWEDIRDTCDAYDKEMQNTFMKKILDSKLNEQDNSIVVPPNTPTT